VPDDPAGEGACGVGLAGAGALDLGRFQAALGGEGVEDLEDVAELLQQPGRGRGGGFGGFLQELGRSSRPYSAGSAWWKAAGWPVPAARSGMRSRTSFMASALWPGAGRRRSAGPGSRPARR
jgi:hypothetical protein